MKALILVGGYGTRLRPLTFSCPKSILPFANKPMVEHQIEALAKIGVTEVILAINYQADKIIEGLKLLEEKYKIKIICSKEPEALGTAGPIKLAESILKKESEQGLLFVFNSDITCNYPLQELVASHKQSKSEASIVLTTVSDPSRFGVVVTKENGSVERFVEKPKDFISNKINAGIYRLDYKVIKRIPERFCMIEKEIFPVLAKEGLLNSITLQNNFWNDVGQPRDYLVGQSQYLEYYKLKAEGPQYHGNVLIDPTAQVHPSAHIGPNVVIGANCVIGEGAKIVNSVIFDNSKVGKSAHISGSLLSWNVEVGNWSRVEGLSVIAEYVKIKDEVRVTESVICSQKDVNGNLDKGSIVM